MSGLKNSLKRNYWKGNHWRQLKTSCSDKKISKIFRDLWKSMLRSSYSKWESSIKKIDKKSYNQKTWRNTWTQSMSKFNLSSNASFKHRTRLTLLLKLTTTSTTLHSKNILTVSKVFTMPCFYLWPVRSSHREDSQRKRQFRCLWSALS